MLWEDVTRRLFVCVSQVISSNPSKSWKLNSNHISTHQIEVIFCKIKKTQVRIHIKRHLKNVDNESESVAEEVDENNAKKHHCQAYSFGCVYDFLFLMCVPLFIDT